MAEDIQGLIDKIQQEGIKAAKDKAKDIEEKAQAQAEGIIAEAKRTAQQLIDKAKSDIARMELTSRALLEQAGRDLVLSLKAEINAMFNKLIVSEAQKAFTPDELTRLITKLVQHSAAAQAPGDIVISLNEKDLKDLGKGFLRKLSDETKKGITLRPAQEISAGFTISYDGSKSHYDFTDQGLAEYLGIYLKPELARFLQKAPANSKQAGKKS